MRESSQSPLKGEASLLAFAAHRERKQAEEDAIRLQNRIRKLNAEKERAEKLIEQTRRKAEELQKIKARCVLVRSFCRAQRAAGGAARRRGPVTTCAEAADADCAGARGGAAAGERADGRGPCLAPASTASAQTRVRNRR